MEIKVRAWDKKEKKMYFYSPWTMLVDGIEGNEFWKANYERFNTDFIEMLFTGRYDKNGNSIWKGDIVKVKSWELVDKNPFAEVCWKKNFKIEHDLDGHYSFCDTYIIDGKNVKIGLADALETLDIEVVGNKYENPKLLKGG